MFYSGTHWMHELIKCVKYGTTCSEPKEKSMLEYPEAIGELGHIIFRSP